MQIRENLSPWIFSLHGALANTLGIQSMGVDLVQYRWMYPFEREIGGFQRTMKTKAQVERSICQAYISKEISNFCSYYFESHVQSRKTRVG